MELKLEESEESRNKGQEEAAELQARYENSEKARQQLTQTLKETKLELERKNEKLISQRGQKQQLLDRRDREKQTLAQNKERKSQSVKNLSDKEKELKKSIREKLAKSNEAKVDQRDKYPDDDEDTKDLEAPD